MRLSKALSFVLRHGARDAGLPMGDDGFVEVGALLRLPRFAGVSEEEVRSVVDADPKGRFALRPNPLRIRANQGHSLQVPALELTPLLTADALPPTLAHGTRRRCWDSIRRGGLAPMGRTHIHLAGGLPGDPGVRSGMRLDSDIAIIIDGPRALAGCLLPLEGPLHEDSGDTTLSHEELGGTSPLHEDLGGGQSH